MSRIMGVKVGPLASAVTNNIAQSQTTSGAAALTLNGTLVSGGVATLDTPRHVIVTSGGNDLGITFTATGTVWGGQAITATVAGTNGGAADFGVSFATISSIATSGATSGSGVIVGTNGVADSAPIWLDQYGYGPTSIQVSVSGTVNYTVSQTLDDPNDPAWVWAAGAQPSSFSNVQWVNHPDTNVVSATATKQSNYAYQPKMTRVTLNSGTGFVVYQVIQSASPVK